MLRIYRPAVALTVILCAWTLDSATAQAQSGRSPRTLFQTAPWPEFRSQRRTGIRQQRPLPARQVTHASQSSIRHAAASQPTAGTAVPITRGYPNLGAPMYPYPRQNVPHQMGGNVITNQAFYPQEMLYPHEYRAMYPPFYYRVEGHFAMMPFGMWSKERWTLQGTDVRVKYRSHYAPFSGFKPPVLR